MAPISLSDRAGLEAARLETLRRQVGDHTTLATVIRWGLMKGHAVSDIVVQDEYTQDVVLPIGDVLHLVYDCT